MEFTLPCAKIACSQHAHLKSHSLHRRPHLATRYPFVLMLEKDILVGAVRIELFIKFTKSRVVTALPAANQMKMWPTWW
jgi:hypothetical protein